MLKKLYSKKLLAAVAAMILALPAVNAFAWQTTIYSWSHPSRYGGESEGGVRTGGVEYSGSQRWVRAGGQNIYWTSAQRTWNINNYYPAEVFHINAKNSSGDTCTTIRTVSGWNWSNLPGLTIFSKGCGIGAGFNGNEIRFYYSAASITAGTQYYFQSLYKDTGYNGSVASKAQAEINFDSYSANSLNIRQFSENHGKICVNPDTTYAPSPGC